MVKEDQQVLDVKFPLGTDRAGGHLRGRGKQEGRRSQPGEGGHHLAIIMEETLVEVDKPKEVLKLFLVLGDQLFLHRLYFLWICLHSQLQNPKKIN